MSIDVTIRQRLFARKTMPLEVILGDRLHYGNFEDDQLQVGELGSTEFVAYDPDRIGRGFSVIWNPSEKKAIHLRLPHPSTPEELRAFYDAVARMTQYWKGRLTVDGNPVRLEDFLTGFDDMADFNENMIRTFSRQVLDGTHNTLTLYAAMWPMTVGPEEAAVFAEDTEAYAAWLHEKQAMDVYFACPQIYKNEDGYFGRYFLSSNLPTLFPYQPTLPFGITDPETGKPLECSRWVICLLPEGSAEPLCEMEYIEFLSRIPKEQKLRYDGARFLLNGLTEEQLQAIAG